MQHDLEHRIPLAPQKRFYKLRSARDHSLCYLAWHKMIDLSFALCGMIVLLLILPFIALLIYVDSPGPIFYVQERLGFRGKKFYIIKFRSMGVDAEASGRAVWATEYDSRVTRVGRVMRRLHLDELPQVLNILRGEMSLIGPRPEREAFVIELEKTLPQYRTRLTVKPGLTGWAQVKYCYARTEQEALAKLRYDLYYIEHRSIKLDIVIILKTVLEVLLCHGT
ncbi:MAG TPA: sugar transferase [Ktedonobacteraceae bacterium]|nr:sugar transferase [Ktedonobacteraceae bacterium]